MIRLAFYFPMVGRKISRGRRRKVEQVETSRPFGASRLFINERDAHSTLWAFDLDAIVAGGVGRGGIGESAEAPGLFDQADANRIAEVFAVICFDRRNDDHHQIKNSNRKHQQNAKTQ